MKGQKINNESDLAKMRERVFERWTKENPDCSSFDFDFLWKESVKGLIFGSRRSVESFLIDLKETQRVWDSYYEEYYAE